MKSCLNVLHKVVVVLGGLALVALMAGDLARSQSRMVLPLYTKNCLQDRTQPFCHYKELNAGKGIRN
jgi:hypothetical protein